MRNYYNRRSFLGKDLRKFSRPYYPEVSELGQRVVSTIPDTITALQYVIYTADLFKDVYMVFRQLDGNGEITPVYKNVGITDAQLCVDFDAQFNEAKMGLPFEFGDLLPSAPDPLSTASRQNLETLRKKVGAVVNANRYKYLKLMELYGFEVSPEVKHEEVYNEGFMEGARTTGHDVNETQDVSTNIKTTHKVATYDNTTKEEYNDETKGNGTDNKSHTYGTAVNNTDTTTPSAISVGTNSNAKADADSLIITTLGTGETMPLHTFRVEKRVITDKDVNDYIELVNADLTAFRLSLEQEFFRDIAKEILLPII